MYHNVNVCILSYLNAFLKYKSLLKLKWLSDRKRAVSELGTERTPHVFPFAHDGFALATTSSNNRKWMDKGTVAITKLV